MEDDILVISVNIWQRCGILDTGELFLIINVYDSEGDDTDNIDEVVTFIGKLPDGRLVIVDMRDFVDATIH